MSLMPACSASYDLATTDVSFSFRTDYDPTTDTTVQPILFCWDSAFAGTLDNRSGTWVLDIPGSENDIDHSSSHEDGRNGQSILKVRFSGTSGCDVMYPIAGNEQRLMKALGVAACAVVHPLFPANNLPAILKDYQKVVSASIRYQEIWINSDASTKHLGVPARLAWNRILQVIEECHEQLTDLDGTFSRRTNRADKDRARRSLAYAVYYTIDGLETMDEDQLKQILRAFIIELLKYISRREKTD